MTIKDKLIQLDNKIKCLTFGHHIEYGYNYEKELMIERCSRCKKILSKALPILEKFK